ncbi:SHOCT domain-containing protein [Nocardiopsis sp. YSL2]|uniref:SHOCT domain-containing protein n=1 Tax=Nocardiopsis sp. YSL2 TaxID=2939492 RepID=UPI0026F458BB|nr:SHOCT domain-containing protein [Nocardiopsis sp. YSL2]
MALAMGAFLMVLMVTMALFLVLAAGSAGRQSEPDRPRPFRTQHDGAPGTDLDAAQEELRLRYARGEVDREEFLQRKIDLER